MKTVVLTYKHTKAFLVEGSLNSWLMVDAGYPESYSAFKSAMKENRIAWEDVGALMITHFHPDHAGLVQTIRSHGVALWLLDCQQGFIEWINDFFEKHVHKQYVPIEPDGVRYLTSAESREALFGLGIAGEITATPGHSDDSVSLVLDDGATFVGDLPKYDLVSKPAQAESWDKLMSLGVKTVYPSHTPPYAVENKP
jgi:glyoxylase-like metal-dependent hydrolase (beta-lactamase superfamily II)